MARPSEFPVLQGMKVCKDCRQDKPTSSYYVHGGITSPYCRSCHRDRTNRWRAANPDKVRDITKRSAIRRYGISPDEYRLLMEQAEGRCQICRQFDALHIDHDATTGKVRGLLCSSCNNGIGRFSHQPDRLRAAAAYLERAASV